MDFWESDLEALFLDYVSSLKGVPLLHGREDFSCLSARSLLKIAEALPDDLLPFFLQLLKISRSGSELFHKLMGEHEEENRELVDSFFRRYMEQSLMPDSGENFNPLLVYLPPDSFSDLVFLQSRESFFLAQKIVHVQEFLQSHFSDVPDFDPCQQSDAWDWFWSRAVESSP